MTYCVSKALLIIRAALLLIMTAVSVLVHPCHGFVRPWRNPRERFDVSLMISLTPLDESASPRQLVYQGMEAFRNGDVKASIELFDKADSKVPDGSLTPYLWQRGLSYYYADRFEEASKQFRTDVKVNAFDVEEIVWDIASQLRLDASRFPPSNMMSLPEGRKDPRKIMAIVYSLFRGECKELDLAAAGHNENIADEFYSLFYLALYCESREEANKAAHYMKRAITTEYATGRGRTDYMTSCARVHCQLRGWLQA